MKEFLQELFRNPYNRDGWHHALEVLLPKANLLKTPNKLDEDDYSTGYELGHLLTGDGYDLGIFEYEIKGGRKIDKNRTGLRNLVSSYLKYNVDAALVVYHDREHWRLSFICDLKKEKTSPKRFTYVFGYPDVSYKTPVERFVSLAESEATFADIYEAFSVDKLDADFFKGYKDLYGVFCKYAPDTKLYRNYIKRMMGRLVFLHFLQKKGWLGGDRNYMTNLLRRSEKKHKDTFLSEVLGVLFFDTLNERRENDAVNSVLGNGVKIPYLNGGLFERDTLDNEGIDFPYECFEWLFNFFSVYNFTVDENDPNDAEIGVDPEMLGHIFENLLEDNKDKGAYYTPKEVVQYMCRESLAQYLKANSPDVPEESIDATVNKYDVTWMMFEEEKSKHVINLLRNIKVCDPAIGSGAFPMGMLNELYNIRRALYESFAGKYPITPYALKKDIIENNIYGVDLDQGAVDIAWLRFWLALLVEDTEQHPLPNLDYKIMQGNSLLESFMGVNLGLYYEKEDSPALHTKPAKDKQGMVAEYFKESDHERKYRLRESIEGVVRDHVGEWSKFRPHVLAKYDELDKTDLPFFLWNLFFHDIVRQGGFDIVIGNPPYGATSTSSDKRQYKMEYGTTSRTYGKRGQYRQKGSDDTYSLFIEQGFNLLKQDGVLSFIVPMSVTSSDSKEVVQTLLLKYCREIKISSYAENPKPVFDNANLATSIISFIKTRTKCEGLYMSKMHRRRSGMSLGQLLSNQKFIEAGDFVLRGRLPKISEQVEKEILSKISPIHPTIHKFIHESGTSDEAIFYRRAGGGYYRVITNYTTGSTSERCIYFDRHIRNLIGAILSTNLYFWYYQVYGDNHNLKLYEIESFPLPIENFDSDLINEISARYEEYLEDIESNTRVLKLKTNKNHDSLKQYWLNKSKAFIDCLDDLICPVYGLSDDEIEFIKNYEIEFRVPDSKLSEIVE